MVVVVVVEEEEDEEEDEEEVVAPASESTDLGVRTAGVESAVREFRLSARGSLRCGGMYFPVEEAVDTVLDREVWRTRVWLPMPPKAPGAAGQ